MKKSVRIIGLIFTFFVCMLFSACKVDYKNLRITFYSGSGEQVESVRLLLDDDESDSATMAIQFDGINEENIDQVLVYDYPSGLVKIENGTVQGNKYFVNLQASSAGNGKLYVKHLASNKTESIDLKVDKRSSYVKTKVSEYVVSIPTENERGFTLDIDALIEQDGTNQIAFTSDNIVSGVTFNSIQFSEDIIQENIIGFKVSSSVNHNSSLTIYPVSFMQGDENVETYENQKITITFAKPLTEETFVLDIDDDHKDNGIINWQNPIYLIAKDTTATANGYQLNNINLDLKYLVGETLSDLIGDTRENYYSKYYNLKYEIPSRFENMIVATINEKNQLVIEAKDYADEIADVKIKLIPKIAGDLDIVEKTVRIKCEIKPTEFEISVQGKIQANNGTKNVYDIDLYDYYRTSVYGANFTFRPLMEYSYADLKNIKIRLNPEILDVKTDNNKNGIHTIENSQDLTTTAVASNKYLLQFYLDGKPLAFEVDDQDKSMVVSKGILYQQDLKRIQIKYTEVSDNNTDKNLTCYVENYYSGEKTYLKNVKSTTATLQFNHKEGITDITIYGGTLITTTGETSQRIETIKQDNTEVKVTDVYLNRADETNYVIYANEILGDKNKIINSASINVKVIGGGNNPLKLQQNNNNSTLGQEIQYDYRRNQGTLNSISMKLSGSTDVGYYTIQFVYNEEVIYLINCLVYEKLEQKDINYVVTNNKNLIQNKVYDTETEQYTYKYDNYTSDYIVKADKNNSVELFVNIPDYFTSDYISGVNFELSLEGQTISDYVESLVDNRKISLTFKKGSYLETGNGYITLKAKIKTQKFANILTKNDSYDEVEIETTFFVFEEITKQDISLNITNVKGYWNGSLSAYLKDLSMADLKVLLPNDKTYLWNYVQLQEQDLKNYKIGVSYNKLASDAEFNAETNYYNLDGVKQQVTEANFEQLKGSLYTKAPMYQVVWYATMFDGSDPSEVLNATEQNQREIKLEFKGNSGTISCDVYAQIKQFDLPELTLKCHIEISTPVVTTNLYLTSETKQIESENRPVISLIAGQEYEVEVEQYSNEFENLPSYQRFVTNPGFEMVVVDSNGNIHDSVVSVSGNNRNILKVKSEFILTSNLKLIVFAKDALSSKLSESASGYNEPKDFLMNNHKSAFFAIDLIVSNGTSANPYPIYDENDFWQINKDTLSKTKYYRLMNNIYLNKIEAISGFSGGLDTLNAQTYQTIYGVKLTNNNLNLFTDFAGSMENINFDVTYEIKEYKVSTKVNVTDKDVNIGVFDVVKGTAKLTNVSATTNGSISFEGASATKTNEYNNYIYVGGLVGTNLGRIEYNNHSAFNSSKLTLSGNYGYFGGLVGYNNGTIIGVEQSADQQTGQNISYTTYFENQGVTQVVNISASGFDSGAFGGLVGLNNGDIQNGYVSGKIDQSEGKLNNVGGVIGKNIQTQKDVTTEFAGSTLTSVTFDESAKVLTNLKSSVQITANNNVGGITGVDENGLYSNAKYQILASSIYGIMANENVGGIIGNAHDSMLEYCSVYSYRWNYTADSLTGKSADITGQASTAGFIGYSSSTAITISDGNNIITAIKNSSINGYINGTHAFIAKSTNTNAIIDAYILGYATNENFNLKGNSNSVSEQANINYVYAYLINKDNKEISLGDISTSTDGSISIRNGWAQNNSINAGKPYILAKGQATKPLFDVAPTSITLKLKDETIKNYGVKDNGGKSVAGIINIDLFDCNLDPNSENYTKDYQTQTNKNTYRLEDLFTITAEPKDFLTEVRLSVTSSDSSVVLVSNSSLIVRAAGQAVITFRSVLNSAVETSITINVANPIGDNVSLYFARDNVTIQGQESEPENKYVVKLTKNEAVLLNYLSSLTETWNEGTLNQIDINLVTNKQTYLAVKVTTTDTLEADKTINDYLQISGKSLTNDSILLDYNTPFSIKACEKIEGVTFHFTVTPYLIISFGDEKYEIKSDKTIYFDVQTVSGVSAISLSTEKVILYPNDTTIITAYLTTDKEISTDDNAYKLISNIQFNERTLSETEIKGLVTIISIGDLTNGKQTIKYQLTMPSVNNYNLHDNNTMIINFAATGDLGTGVKNSVQLSLLKQRIDELVVRNYIYERDNNGDFDYTKYTQKNTLRPVGEGLITIDVSPINGYYDCLEISDITGGEEIVFVQTDAPHGKRVLDNVQASSDNLGIRLKNPNLVNANNEDKCIYIASMIDANYTSRKHTVQVRAYVGGELIKSTDMEIDVKMLPEANIYLVKSDGTIVRNWNGTQYVADKTTIRFKVETKNSDDVEPAIEAKIGATDQTITNEGNGIYSIKLEGNNAGNTLTIKATTYLTLDNGDREEATTSVDYSILNYVINDMSVTHSTTTTVNGEKQTKIYGNLGANIDIEFYFKNTDLDYVDNLESYTKDSYKEGSNGYPISNLLASINGKNALSYLTFDTSRVKLDDGKITTNDTKTEVYIEKDGNSTAVASLTVAGNGINVVMNRDLDIDLALTLKLDIDNNNFVLTLNETPKLTKTFIYQLDFIEESSFLEPVAVRTQEDFENMSSGGDYILANDIEFEAYTPINVKLNTFDGNGHKITIKSFGLFGDANISAGLFKQIEEGMVVSNLTIEYSLGDASKEYFYNLCNDTGNVSYTDANFGGVAATNSGIITNCHVVGKVALCATGVEQVVSNDEINFNIAGLVAENTNTGRITHSSSELNITAKANIAGVVYTNSGKIASTYFDAGENKGKIYAYNNNVIVPYSINVAGFVFSNESSGEISMSYVESGTHTRNGSKIGNISAKDYSSGFVFENRGSIYDCYADIELIGESSHNHISGFVYNNSGSVSNCYSYINKGNKTNLLSMFALENSTGISNCYEVKQETIGYDNNVDGLTTVSVLNRTLKTSYPTFMFGDNKNAVWQILSSSLPKISSTLDKVEFTGDTFDSDADKNAEYPSRMHGLKDLELVRTEVKDDNDVVINVQYKYKLIANDYGEKQNPILIYDLKTWNYYLGQTDITNSYFNNTKYYYRILNDISFEQVYDNPTTSKYQFNGNIQGNNMDVSGFKIFSSENLDCIGLFGSLISLNNKSMENAIRNLDLLPTKVTASRTKSVGVLAGLAENFNLYNIDVNAAGVTIVGGNAVGGVAGLVRGKFDIDGISSNIGAYSSRSQQDNNYSIYLSNYQSTRFSSDNLQSVYYAGSAFGILDTYNSSTINHLNVAGNLILQGDTVGAAIGLIGKNVKVSNVIVDVTAGKFSGYQYSAGLAGENRGTISQATVSLAGENLFKNSTFVSAGLVGFNLGGTIENVSVYAEISKVNQSIVAGIVGRNLKGSVKNSTIDGLLDGYFVGGVIGADYNIDTFMTRTAVGGGGAIRISESDLSKLASSTSTIENVSLSSNLVDNLLLNLNSFYSVKILNQSLIVDCNKVLGLAIGLTDSNSVSFKLGYDVANKCIVINNDKFISKKCKIKYGENDITIASDDVTEFDDTFTILSGYPLPEKFTNNFAIMYIAGAKVESFDFCLLSNGYVNSTMFAIKR